MLTGAISTLFLKEGKQLTLEELSNEQQDTFIGGMSRIIADHVQAMLTYCI